MSKESKIILGVAGIVVITLALLISFVNSNKMDPSAVMDKVVREDSHSIGTGDVQVVEFGDYQCPACGQVYPDVQKLKKEYKDDITFVYRNFPLPMHQNAQAAAEAAEAAAKQDKFWQMHDMLFETQSQWSPLADPTSIFVQYAEKLKLDKGKFTKDLTTKSSAERISKDQSDGYAVGVTGTPTFFINGKKQDKFDYESLKKSIESEIK